MRVTLDVRRAAIMHDRMGQVGRKLARGLALFVAGAICASLVGIAIGAFSLGTGNIREPSVSEGAPLIGLRPTGVGLPLVGAEGTVGAGDYAGELVHYHDSGEYDEDLAAVGQRALRYVKRRSRAIRRQAAEQCRRAEPGGSSIAAACRKPKLGIVLDIDETTLSSYDCLASTGFTNTTAAQGVCIATMANPAIAPTKRIYDYALGHRIGVYFITGRPDAIPGLRMQTETTLRAEGFERWEKLIMAPSINFDTIEYKSEARAGIEAEGVRIIANVGDQESDLVGGHADRAFKYPNPFYFIGE